MDKYQNFLIEQWVANESLLSSLKIEQRDYWNDLFEDPWLKYVGGPMCLFTSLATSILLFSIMRYIDDRHLKTLLHRVDKANYAHILGFAIVYFPVPIARIYVGPLPEYICWWNKLMLNFNNLGMIMSTTSMFLIRYLAITRRIDILGTDDQFFNVFWNASVAMVAFLMALLNNLVPGRFELNYYMCTGEDPLYYQALGDKPFITGYIPPFAAVICTIVVVRIHFIKKALEKADQQQQGNLGGNQQPQKKLPQAKEVAQSITSCLSITCLVVGCFSEAILWNVWIKEIPATEVLNTFIGRFGALHHVYGIYVLALWAVVFASFTSKKELKPYVLDMLK